MSLFQLGLTSDGVLIHIKEETRQALAKILTTHGQHIHPFQGVFLFLTFIFFFLSSRSLAVET
jgi:hypothetical protein